MKPLDVPCPKCGAGIDRRCRTTSGTGRTTDTHVDRIDRANRPDVTPRENRPTLTPEPNRPTETLDNE